MVFVFGSNEAGIHGAGAARVALIQKGAIIGQGIGRMGQSFGIPTKDEDLLSLPTKDIANYVAMFIRYARANPSVEFQVTQIGCGLAGFTPVQIAPLFKNAPENCYFDTAWKFYLPKGTKFWGTYA